MAPQEDEMDPRLLREFLAEAGYEIRERQHEWAECLVLGHGENWLGVGADPEDALARAIGLCFPSAAARRALQAALAARGAALPRASDADGARIPEAPPVPETEDAPPPEPTPTDCCPAADGEAGRRSDSGAGNVPAEPARTELRTLAELRELLEQIDSRQETLALASPRRQRLVILGWLAAARSAQEDHPGSEAVADATDTIVRRLRALSEAWWPGMITAFQLGARPRDSRRDLRDLPFPPASSWGEVAQQAREALQRQEEADAAAGLDSDGWGDRAQLCPAPGDAEALLDEIVSEVEEATGSLEQRQPKGRSAPPRSDVVRWARLTRWLRGSVPALPWVRLCGRLRFLVSQHFSEDRELAQLLDATFAPPRSWRALLRTEEQEQREQRELAAVVASVPRDDAAEEELLAWLRRALPLTSNHQEAILRACMALHPRIAAIEEAQLPRADRRIRRRLQKLKEAIAGGPPRPAEERPPELPPPAPTGIEPPEPVLAQTRGRRALLVSNRIDEELTQRLVAKLGLAELESTESTPRRIEAAVEKIQSGAYDLVLGATGFLDHTCDNQIARACRSAAVPYVRTDRSRPAAVIRALARDLGRA